jgi:poly(A) polymerase
MPSPELERIRAAAPVEDAWLVGGSVRDLLLGRPVTDVDLVVPGDPAAAARRLAREGGGAPFPLSERHGAWRVVRDGWTVDVAACRGGSIEADLGHRDFTINAIALALAGGEPIDPSGGLADLEARSLRVVSDSIFDDDPLRLLRLARMARELGFEIDQHALDLARARAQLADRPSGERIYMEVRRLVGLDDPAAGVRLLDRMGVLEVLPRQAAAVAEELARPVGDDLEVAGVLRLAALFHDIRKPQTRAVSGDGRISFMGHDAEGADAAGRVLRRWHAAGAVVRCCQLLVGEHLRLGFMIRQRPLDRRAAHRYLRATAPYPLASIVLSLADRLATRGLWARQRHHRRHAETAADLAGMLVELAANPAPPLLRGDEVAAMTGARGARIGELVEALAEEQAAGAVTTREQAEAFLAGAAGEEVDRVG